MPDERVSSDLNEINNGNNVFTNATEIKRSQNGFFSTEFGSIHEITDVDFYSFNLDKPASKQDSINLYFDNSDGNLDIELFSEDSNNLTSLAVGSSHTDNETLSLNGFGAGKYILKVSGKSSAKNNYSLDIYQKERDYYFSNDYQEYINEESYNQSNLKFHQFL